MNSQTVDHLQMLTKAFEAMDYNVIVGKSGHTIKDEVSDSLLMKLDGISLKKYNLWKISGVAVCRARAIREEGKNTGLLLRHHHPEWEFVVCVKGHMDVYICPKSKTVIKVGRCDPNTCHPEKCEDAKKHVLFPKGHVSVDSEVVHCVVFHEDTEYISVSIPASDHFPGEIEHGEQW